MNIKPIRSQEDLTAAFARVEQLWGADIGSPEGDELEILALLIEKYEDEHYPMQPSDPIEAIKFRMDQQGLTPRDLEPFIGTSGRVSEVLNRKRKLSLSMIKRPLQISANVFPLFRSNIISISLNESLNKGLRLASPDFLSESSSARSGLIYFFPESTRFIAPRITASVADLCK